MKRKLIEAFGVCALIFAFSCVSHALQPTPMPPETGEMEVSPASVGLLVPVPQGHVAMGDANPSTGEAASGAQAAAPAHSSDESVAGVRAPQTRLASTDAAPVSTRQTLPSQQTKRPQRLQSKPAEKLDANVEPKIHAAPAKKMATQTPSAEARCTIPTSPMGSLAPGYYMICGADNKPFLPLLGVTSVYVGGSAIGVPGYNDMYAVPFRAAIGSQVAGGIPENTCAPLGNGTAFQRYGLEIVPLGQPCSTIDEYQQSPEGRKLVQDHQQAWDQFDAAKQQVDQIDPDRKGRADLTWKEWLRSVGLGLGLDPEARPDIYLSYLQGATSL